MATNITKGQQSSTNIYIRRIVLIFFIILSFSCRLFSSTMDQYKNRITEHTLKNGLHFILLEDHTAPVVSFHIHVKVGSVNEKLGDTGISHLIEHLAFNGTPTLGTTDWRTEKSILEKIDKKYKEIKSIQLSQPHNSPLIKQLYEEFSALNSKAATFNVSNEFGKILDMHGAVGPNAYCSYDMTAFWVELPSNRVELWAALESNRLFNPVFRGFYEELEVVKEERRMRVDNSPFGKLMEEFLGLIYKIHPYRNPIVGYSEDLNNMSREKVKNFYKKYYIPSNIIISVAGDIYPDTFLPLVKKYFENIPSGQTPPVKTFTEPESVSEKQFVINMDSQPIFLLGYPIPDIKHKDVPALQVCAEILASGRTSKLYQRLVKEEKSAVSTGSWCWTPQYPGIFYLFAISSQNGNNKQLETSIIETIEDLKKGCLTEEEILGAKARLRIELLASLKSKRKLARELAYYKAITGDWQNLFKYEEKIRDVSLEDIKRVAKEYFTEARRTIGKIEPLKKD
ncbi:insulinase family protein [bacterium]|nr:insulinase family protein [bacterium]